MQPVSDQFLAALGVSGTPSSIATVTADDGTVTELPIEDGTVNLDATAETRASLDMSLAIGPEDLALIPDDFDSLLAPGTEITVECGRVWEEGTVDQGRETERVPLGVFILDEVESTLTNDGGIEVQIAGLDRSARAIDAVFEAAGDVAAATDAADEIATLLGSVVPNLTLAPDWGETTVSLPALHYEEGDDRWDFCRGLAEAAGGTLYFDGTGTLCLRTLIPISLPGVWTIATGADGVMLGASKRWGLEDACNRVVVYGENPGNTAPYRGEAKDEDLNSPTRYNSPSFGNFTFTYSSPYVTSDTHAAAVAEAILRQRLGAPRQINLTSLVNPALEPNDVIEVTAGDLGVSRELHVIDQLSIPLAPSGEMSIQTRITRVVA